METQDKISFALAHRHLGNKNVVVKGHGEGKCVGIDAPHIIVKLISGMTVQVSPSEIESV